MPLPPQRQFDRNDQLAADPDAVLDLVAAIFNFLDGALEAVRRRLAHLHGLGPHQHHQLARRTARRIDLERLSRPDR